MKVLMVLTSHDQLGNTWRKTGFWLQELAAPYYVFKETGAEITLGSPKGGVPRSIPRVTSPNSEPTLRAGSDADASRIAASVRARAITATAVAIVMEALATQEVTEVSWALSLETSLAGRSAECGLRQVWQAAYCKLSPLYPRAYA